MRPPHWLKPNRSSELPSHVIFVDTETLPTEVAPGRFRHDLWFGWAQYVRRHRGLSWTPPEWLRFEDSEAFWLWVEGITKAKRKVYVIAHNLGYDAMVTQAVTLLKSRGWTLGGAIIDDPPTVLRYRRAGASLVLMDSLNIFRMSLSQVGAYVGRPKLEMPSPDSSQGAWDEYCRGDVSVLSAAMMLYWQTVREWDLGNFQYTLPGQAFAAYRHRFMTEPIFIDNNAKALDLSRRSYAGGRVEAFQLGRIDGEVHCLDVNSMYPYIMYSNPSPVKLQGTVGRTKIEELVGWLDHFAMIADVELETDLPIYPVKFDGHLVFPVGRFRAVLATPELELAIEHEHIRRIRSVALYTHAPLFQSYIQHFWERRQAARARGNEPEAWMCKLLLNSLYGKFGQTGRVYDEVGETPSDEIKTWAEWDADTGTLHRYRQLGGLIQEESRDGESRDSHPSIAAHVTSAARVHLWGLMDQAGRQNVLYCDTDSLMVNAEGLERLQLALDPDILGCLKVEWSSKNLTIRGVKDYSVNGEDKIKGIRKNAVELAPGRYEQDLFRGLRGAIQDGELDVQIVSRQVHQLTRRYRKGTVDRRGLVSPFRFPLGTPHLPQSAPVRG